MSRTLNCAPLSELMSRLQHEQDTDLALGMLESATDSPRLLKGVVAVLRETISDPRIDAAIADLGLGAVSGEEAMTGLANLIRGTHVDQEEFETAGKLLDAYYTDMPTRDLYEKLYRSGGKRPTLDGLAVLIPRAERDPWARRRLRKDWKKAKHKRLFAGRHLSWLPRLVEGLVGGVEPPYLTRLWRNSVDAVAQGQGAFGLAALIGVLMTIGLVVVAMAAANSGESNQPQPQPVKNQPPGFEQRVEEELAKFNKQFDKSSPQPLVFVLPTGREKRLTALLTRHLRDSCRIIGDDYVRQRLKVSVVPESSAWIPKLLPKLIAGQEGVDQEKKPLICLAQLRVDDQNRPLLRICEPVSGRVHVYVLGTREEVGIGKHAGDPNDLTFEELIDQVETALLQRRFDDAEQYLVFADVLATTDSQRKKYKACHDRLQGARASQPKPS